MVERSVAVYGEQEVFPVDQERSDVVRNFIGVEE